MTAIYSADKIFTGSSWLEEHVILVQDGIITGIHPKEIVGEEIEVHDYKNFFIAPAFIDIQIYGAKNLLFAVYPTAEALDCLRDHNLKGGTHNCLPTVATNSYDTFYNCIDAVRAYWKVGGKGVLGLHIEGPWINKLRRGAHVERFIHSPTLKQTRDLLEYGRDVIKMITLAPEVCSSEVVQFIQSYGIIVSAGHSNATYSEAVQAFESGIPVATHLFNAMSPLHHREPGLPGAVLQHDKTMASIIPDGYHVDFSIVAIAKKLMKERLFMITDAVTETTEGYYQHKKDGDKYVCEGILSGSALTLMGGVKNCVEHVGADLGEALRMASLYPAQVLGVDNKLGKIEKGCKAELIVFTKDFEMVTNIFG